MNELAWKNDYRTGNALIDREHQQLVVLANRIIRFSEAGQEAAAIKSAIVALYDYTRSHFSHEEEYMERIGYPDLAQHRRLHADIIGQLNKLLKESDRLQDMVPRLRRLMVVWVIEHIVHEDGKMAAHSKPTD